MGVRLTVVLMVTYIIQLVLYYVGTIAFNVSSTELLANPYVSNAPWSANVGSFLSSMNIEIQAGLAVEGLVILAMFFVAAFRVRGDQTRL